MATRFEYKRNLIGVDHPKMLHGDATIVANSVVIKIGDAVKWDTDGFIALAAATNKVLGIVAGVTDLNGINVDPDSGTLDTFTMNSANETTATFKYRVSVIVDDSALFKNDSSGTLAQTNIGQFFDLTDEDQIDQSSASDTSGQFQLIQLDPDAEGDASMGLFKIAESQLHPYAQA